METVSNVQAPLVSVTRFTVFSPASSKPLPSGQPGQEYHVSPDLFRPSVLCICPSAA